MNKFMASAIKEAKKGIARGDGGPFGAVVVKDNEIISKAHNMVVAKNDPTCHGEMEAIRKACNKLKTFDLTGCELYTTGYPCPMCLCAARWANIQKIYYGCNTTDAEKIGFRDKIFENDLQKAQTTFCQELDRAECLSIYAQYNSQQNKTLY